MEATKISVEGAPAPQGYKGNAVSTITGLANSETYNVVACIGSGLGFEENSEVAVGKVLDIIKNTTGPPDSVLLPTENCSMSEDLGEASENRREQRRPSSAEASLSKEEMETENVRASVADVTNDVQFAGTSAALSVPLLQAYADFVPKWFLQKFGLVLMPLPQLCKGGWAFWYLFFVGVGGVWLPLVYPGVVSNRLLRFSVVLFGAAQLPRRRVWCRSVIYCCCVLPYLMWLMFAAGSVLGMVVKRKSEEIIGGIDEIRAEGICKSELEKPKMEHEANKKDADMEVEATTEASHTREVSNPKSESNFVGSAGHFKAMQGVVMNNETMEDEGVEQRGGTGVLSFEAQKGWGETPKQKTWAQVTASNRPTTGSFKLNQRPAERTRVRDCISLRTPTRVVAESVSARNLPQVSVAKNSQNFVGRSILTKEEIYAIEQWLIECGYQTQVDNLKKEAKDDNFPKKAKDERISFDKYAGVRDVGKESLKVFSSTETVTKIEDEAEEKGRLLADGIKFDSGRDETVSEGEELELEIAIDEESEDEVKEEQRTVPNPDPCSSEVRLSAPNVNSSASSHPFVVNVVEISHPLRMNGDRILKVGGNGGSPVRAPKVLEKMSKTTQNKRWSSAEVISVPRVASDTLCVDLGVSSNPECLEEDREKQVGEDGLSNMHVRPPEGAHKVLDERAQSNSEVHAELPFP
ncbi:hypothetical protein U1Q18_017916 [Sarracenia purpurea var. burkii]